MLDPVRLRADAVYAIESGDPLLTRLGKALVKILDDPSLVVPEGCALVRRPELLGKGVPRRG